MLKNRFKKSLALNAVLGAAMLVALALVPHETCGCGQYEDGSQLTHFINSISEKISGKPLIEKNPNPWRSR